MAENSFYGGRPGYSCVIVRSFSSIDEMVNKFKLGGGYSEVHYNEYVIINTNNKNDKHNGSLYRRGYDYTNDMGGAIYIGTIVGPGGKAPQLELTTIEDIERRKNTEGFDDRYNSGEYKPTENLIPGKNGEIYNDSIKWASYSIRDINNEDTIAYLGFKIPYLVEEFIGESGDPYKTTGLVSRQDQNEHPFYQKWKITVPKGIKGDSLQNFRVMVANDSIQNYATKQDDIKNQREVLVYDCYTYDNNSQGEHITLYVGPCNMIKDIQISEDGTVTISYTYNADKKFEKILKTIKTINMGTDGIITVTYNTGAQDTFTQKVKWLTNVDIETAKGTDGEGSGDQKIHISYNDGSSKAIGNGLNYIIETAINDKFHLLVYYSDPEKRKAIPTNKKVSYNDKSDWLDLGSVKDEDGILIGLNLDPSKDEKLKTVPTTIQYLNETYSGGLTEPGIQGKIVTVGNESGDDNKDFYAFDYESKTWFYLGNFDIDIDTVFIVGGKNDPDIGTKKEGLMPGGIWFVVEGEDD